jgi:hypothetical protein
MNNEIVIRTFKINNEIFFNKQDLSCFLYEMCLAEDVSNRDRIVIKAIIDALNEAERQCRV